MNFGEPIFLYCERGNDSALLAEPINALSNGAFLVAALIGLQLLLWRPRVERSADHYLLVALVFFIGLGSLAFHLLATRETALLDVVPIGVFMLVYLGFALNRFLGVPPGFTVLLVAGFAAILSLTGQVKCGGGVIGFGGAALPDAKPCLNGSLFYLPALAALIVVGLLARERQLRAAPYLLWAAAIFTISVTLRSLDLALCDVVQFEGRKVGTHFAWHILNAVALFLLLRASLEGGALRVGALMTESPQPEPVAGPEPQPVAEPEPKSEPEPAEPEAESEPSPAAAADVEEVASEAEEAPKEEAPDAEPASTEAEPKPKAFFPA
jgi:hypothetical protein